MGWVTDLWNSRGHAEEDKANSSWEKLHFGSEIGRLSRCVDLKCVLLCIEAKELMRTREHIIKSLDRNMTLYPTY
jgi:hypothetical protein